MFGMILPSSKTFSYALMPLWMTPKYFPLWRVEPEKVWLLRKPHNPLVFICRWVPSLLSPAAKCHPHFPQNGKMSENSALDGCVTLDDPGVSGPVLLSHILCPYKGGVTKAPLDTKLAEV